MESENKTPVIVLYENWKGEIWIRTIIPEKIYEGSNEWHPEKQYLLDCFDVEKQAKRTFACSKILAWGKDEVIEFFEKSKKRKQIVEQLKDALKEMQEQLSKLKQE